MWVGKSIPVRMWRAERVVSFITAEDGVKAIKGGKMTIVEMDDNYMEITFDLLAEEDYQVWHGVYYGEME